MKPAKSPAPAKVAVKKTAPPAETSIALSFAAMLMGLILVSALAAFVYGNERSDVMLAVSREARGATSLKSMDTPNIGSDAVINWSKLAVSEIFTYNFNDISPRMLAAERFFTKEGWTAFILALGKQDLLSRVQTGRQFVSTVPSGDAVISEEGDVGGTYFWNVQMNIVTSVYAGETDVKKGQLSLKIARIPTRNSDSGYPFGIVQIK